MKKRLLCLVFLATVLLGIGPVATAQDQTSFSTPEEAITFYMQGVAEGDISKIMQACAVNEMSENFRFDLYTEWVQYLTLMTPAPSDNPFYKEINKAQFSWQILNQVKNLTYGLLATEKGTVEGRTVPIDAAGTIQFMEEVNPERLAQLQVTMMGVPSPELANHERNQNNWNRIAQVYWADELTERVVLFTFEGDTYLVGFMVLRYGDNWKISSANSVLGNTSVSGAPQPITEEEFQELIGSD